MAEIPSSMPALAQSNEDMSASTGSDSGSSGHKTPPPFSKPQGLGETSPADADTREALQRLTIDDKGSSETTEHSTTGASIPGNTCAEDDAAFEENTVHDTASSAPIQRPWAEPPIVNYTETLDRQVKWQKLFVRLTSVTPAQRCRIFDLVGENDALRLYISSLPESGDTHGEFADGLFEEVYSDQRAVEEELNGFMDREGLTEKIQVLKESLPWEEWCAIWCDGNHQRDCPASELGH